MRARRLNLRELARVVRDDDVTPAELAAADLARPKIRAHCEDAPRPCPFVSCRYHLAFEVARNGSLWMPHGEEPDLEAMRDTCALDVADRGGVTLDDLAVRLNVTRERSRQEIFGALVRMRRRVERLRAEEAAEWGGG